MSYILACLNSKFIKQESWKNLQTWVYRVEKAELEIECKHDRCHTNIARD